MLLAATAGTLADFAYGWNVGCEKEVELYKRTMPKSPSNEEVEAHMEAARQQLRQEQKK
jgi:hypothetical protein